ncbi:GalNAc-alpha-(1-_4)-GalNAc-alpha-(1-_3)-diNAcBac-PP-undecaprenol alpha-1,4-N-acetyl-D-galactosaminyltransferase [Gimesia panareensis]|uniref:GalNAc-alpha-(1->4)-GalNAc-alpha-(1->3)-diNAcBac-PP-undecaprenol alpha-1,4-N-acetyl-D-galactosaminyltransferase n=1 Tax=Gimesia panareensis TaxID=2527978 RepID=A0A518FP84_9PLAN|nr:glycosyltransferase family 4 protein [Gimesia panareensis]QDV18163.1 GalNAc-alpha-(1->4)-GalNAc-alpha-(1->3)-diNAcBac-PP-undecaprenol alpha-1,4-N-acetyl-D-galactosaminyltransferase [Gimesia panareensis]
MSRRITITVPSLSLGGAEGVAAMMANHWAAEGDQVTLITLDSAETDTFKLVPEVQRFALAMMRDSGNLFQAVVNNRRRVQKLRSAITESKPEVVISLTDRMNVLTLLATGKSRYPVIVSERSDPRHHPMGRVWSFLRKRTYPLAAAVVVQTQGVADFCRTWLPSTRVEVIPNAVPASRSSGIPVVTEEIVKARPASLVVLGMGRLSHEKGFDMLIDAFSNLAHDFPDWKLRILGEGPMRETLQATIDQRGLQDRIELPGWVADPERALDQGDLFVLPSRYEGFPNALLQAMSRGLSCISFNCESGPADIAREGLPVGLVSAGNVSELTERMQESMLDKTVRLETALQSLQVTQRFSLERYFQSWDQLIEQTLTGRET